MAKVETTLTLEQLDAALEFNGKLRAFDAGYAKGFAAGLEAGAQKERQEFAKWLDEEFDPHWGEYRNRAVAMETAKEIATAIRERAKEEKCGKTIEREGK